MTDIVERLRHWTPAGDASVFAPVVEAADTIEALRAENARLCAALKPLAALTKEILDEKGQPSGDFLFDTWTDDQAVFFLDTKRIITAGDIRTAYQLLNNSQ